MKRFALVIVLIYSMNGYGQTSGHLSSEGGVIPKKPGSQVSDSARISSYKELSKTYERLSTGLYSLYNDSIKICWDSIAAIISRQRKTNGNSNTEGKNDSVKYNFSFRLFTDFVGFKSDQPNGLAQAEIAFSWKVNTRTFDRFIYHTQHNKEEVLYGINKLKRKIGADTSELRKAKDKDEWREKSLAFNKTGTPLLVPFHNIVFPIIVISKIKDSLRYKQLNYDTTGKLNIKHINTFDLIKYSNFSVSGCLNLLTFKSPDKSTRIFLDLYGTFYSTGVYDTSKVASSNARHNVNSAGYGINLSALFEPPDYNFSLKTAFSYFSLYLFNNEIRQSRGIEYFPVSNPRNNIFPTTNTADAISIANVSVRYSSKKNKDNKNNQGMFLSIAYYSNMFVDIVGNKVHGNLNLGNNFLQVQFGISKTIDDLTKFLKP